MTELEIVRTINYLLSIVAFMPLIIVMHDLIVIYHEKQEAEKKKTAMFLMSIVAAIMIYFTATGTVNFISNMGRELTTLEYAFEDLFISFIGNVIAWTFLIFEKSLRTKLFDTKQKKK